VQTTAAIAALLRASPNRTKLQERVGNKLSKHGISTPQLNALLGRTGTPSVAPPTRAQLTNAVALSQRAPLLYLREAITLPPETVPTPSTFELRVAGVLTSRTRTKGRNDTLSGVVVIATPKGQDYVLRTITLDDLGGAPGSHPVRQQLFSDSPTDALVVTAVVEGKGRNATASREQVETLVAAAASVAATISGDRVHTLKAMVDYTLAIAPDDARSVVCTEVAGAEWSSLWAAGGTEQAGLRWKVAVPHAIGRGRYEFLLNVPSPPTPTLPIVRIAPSALRVENLPEGKAFMGQSVVVAIGNRSHTFVLDRAHAATLPPVERKVAGGTTPIRVVGSVEYRDIKATKDLATVAAEYRTMCPRSLDGLPREKRKRCRRLRRMIRLLTERSRTETAMTDFGAADLDYSIVHDGFVKARHPKAGAKPSAQMPSSTPADAAHTLQGSGKPRATLTLNASDRTSGS
jgi:hypothetical protein